MADVVSDLFTRIRNAQRAGHQSVIAPKVTLVQAVLSVLKREGYIEGYEPMADSDSSLTVHLRYVSRGRPVISKIDRVSTSGRRVYSGKESLSRIRSGLGIRILSTSKGVLSDREAKSQGVGGEVLGVVS